MARARSAPPRPRSAARVMQQRSHQTVETTSVRLIPADPANLPHRAMIELGDEVLDPCVTAIRDEDGTSMGPLVTWEVVTDAVWAEEREAAMQQEIAASAWELGARLQGSRDLVKRFKV